MHYAISIHPLELVHVRQRYPNMTKPLLSRRRFLQLAGGLALSSAAGFGYTRLLEPNWVEVVAQPLSIPDLPDHLAGVRIAQLSDIHLGQYTGPEKLLSAVERVNRLAPDLVFLTGDYVTRSAGQASGLVEPLRALTAPTYASLGNPTTCGPTGPASPIIWPKRLSTFSSTGG